MLGDMLGSILHPAEIGAMFRLKFGGWAKKPSDEPLADLGKTLNSNDFCYAALAKVSRSFSVVIQQLPDELKDPVCIFYLVLRGLDSVEDDMTVELSKKCALLRCFYQKLYQTGWNISGVGDGPDYRVLLANFEKVIEVFLGLHRKYQETIADICRRMGEGMAEFAEKRSVATVKEYNLYCHYVAGLVGHGLTNLFANSGLEDPNLNNSEGMRIANSMGLFLQKTNIIRDYLEDLEQGRTWYPEEIWKLYGTRLDYFKNKPNAPESLACLNHMVTDALEHMQDCLDYMARLSDPQVFRFCAIPQVMAIATLAACYNNKDVFRRVVKIRKGLSCKLMLQTNDMTMVSRWFHQFASEMRERVPNKDPNAKRARELLDGIIKRTRAVIPHSVVRLTNLVMWCLFLFCVLFLFTQYRQRANVDPLAGGTANSRSLFDYVVMLLCFLSLNYLLGFFTLQ